MKSVSMAQRQNRSTARRISDKDAQRHTRSTVRLQKAHKNKIFTRYCGCINYENIHLQRSRETRPLPMADKSSPHRGFRPTHNHIFRHIFYLWPFSPMRGVILRLLDKNFKSFLDIGCGQGNVSLLLRYHGILNLKSVGVDLNPSYLSICKQDKLYDEVVLADAAYLPFKPKSFDCTFLIDVIEHTHKDDGKKLLLNVEKIAGRQIIISTPVGFKTALREGRSRDPLEFYLQKHKSAWLPNEFRELGYIVRGDIIAPPFLPLVVAYFLSAFLPITYLWPELSHHMVAIKHQTAHFQPDTRPHKHVFLTKPHQPKKSQECVLREQVIAKREGG